MKCAKNIFKVLIRMYWKKKIPNAQRQKNISLDKDKRIQRGQELQLLT